MNKQKKKIFNFSENIGDWILIGLFVSIIGIVAFSSISFLLQPQSYGHVSDFAWSHDGTKVALRIDFLGDQDFVLYVIDLEKNEREEIFESYGFYDVVAWGPNDEYLTFSQRGSIYNISTEGNEDKQLLIQLSDQLQITGLEWSPNGKRLAIVTKDEVLILNTENNEITTIDRPVFSRRVEWSEDGSTLSLLYQHIYYYSYNNSIQNDSPTVFREVARETMDLPSEFWIYSYNLETGETSSLKRTCSLLPSISYIKPEDHFFINPSDIPNPIIERRYVDDWSRDENDDFIFLGISQTEDSSSSTAFSVVTSSIFPTLPRTQNTFESHPLFSPNHTKILFVRTITHGVERLYIMNVDGTNERQLYP